MRKIAQELSLRAEDPSTAAYRLQASFGITMNNRRSTILDLKQSQLEQGVAPKCITTNIVPLSSFSSSTSTRAKKGTTRTTAKSKLELMLDDSSSPSFSSSSSSVYLGSGEEKEDIQNRIEAFSKALHKTPLLPSLSSITLDTEVVKMVKSMPREWTVCSLGIETTAFSRSERYLLVTRLTKEFEPVVIRLPLFSSEETEDTYQGILSELKEIMKENKDSLFSDNPDMRDPVKWNQKRIDLDLRVKDLVLRLEQRWLGCWKVCHPVFGLLFLSSLKLFFLYIVGSPFG
jgi:hypothetical protein